MKQYKFTAQVLFEVPDDMEFCDGDGDNDQVCTGDCGGACDIYFWDRLKAWFNNDPDEGHTQCYNTSIEREDDIEDDEPAKLFLIEGEWFCWDCAENIGQSFIEKEREWNDADKCEGAMCK